MWTLCRGNCVQNHLSGVPRLSSIRYASTTNSLAASPISRHGLSYHWDTPPATEEQLRRAERFFKAAPPKIVDSAIKFRTVKETLTPEVAFLGRSNVGKSSLLNALLAHNICHTSSRPGRTKSMNFFAIGGEDHLGSPGRLVVLDMPGYGKGSHEDWGTEITKYLVGRKQLRRVFLLIDARHGLKTLDESILSLFRHHGIAHQVILSKIDHILFPKNKVSEDRMEKALPVLDEVCANLRSKIQPSAAEGPEALGEIICTSAETTINGKKLGVGELRWAVLVATGLGSERKSRAIP